MFYPSYDDYMRDIFYYNGVANNNMGYLPAQVMPNYTIGNNGMGGYYMQPTQNNINNLYPSIYRIVYPVVQKVTSENNYQCLTDETVTNATNTVYNIVEGDCNSSQDSSRK